jgi:hypothetical protein
MCAVPKGFKKDLSVQPKYEGLERIQQLRDDIAYKGTMLPKGVHYIDIDTNFIEFVKNDLSISIDGEKVPVIFLTLQRWSEFSKTWEFTDEFKNIKVPFITIVRRPDVQVGTIHDGLWNVPGRPNYYYVKVASGDATKKGVDLYKIPQPTAVDVVYEVRIFCNRMTNLNLMNELVQKTFNARQFYIYPNGHPMPIVLDSISDESTIGEFEDRRLYIQPYEMRVQGYIMDEKDFTVVPTVTRAMLFLDIVESVNQAKVNIFTDNATSKVNLNFIFKPLALNTVDVSITQKVLFESVEILSNTSSVVFKVNNVTQTLPFVIEGNTMLNVSITRDNSTDTSQFLLKGTAL